MSHTQPADSSPDPKTSSSELTPFHRGATFLLFFASGFAGLVYQVLWMKELGLLFGNTAQAAATTLAAFFLGLVAGAGYWGRQAGDVRSPLRGYAALEGGVAVSALLYFFLLDAYYGIYSSLFQAFGHHPALFLAVKFFLAAAVLLPPSFFMGGTLPMMSQHLVRRPKVLGRTASALYAVNTLGAAAGAYAAGFHLPRSFGFANSYMMAVVITGLVALLAWVLGAEKAAAGVERTAATPDRDTDEVSVSLRPVHVLGLAFFSGLATLSLEVLWTRMFAQVLQNSVYTFSTILVTFLVALALGAALASWLIRKSFEPVRLLLVLLVTSAFLVGITPFVFFGMTDGLEYFGGERSFASYVAATFWCAAVVMLVPGLVLGTLFPYLLKLAESFTRGAGRTVGDLTAVNTLGAVAGSLVAGFVLLDVFGLWASIRLVAAAYFCAALLVAYIVDIRGRLLRLVPVGGLLLLVSILDPSRLPIVKVDPVEKGESVLRVWEGSSGIISVIREPTSLSIKMDNDYSLGGTGAAAYEEAQAHLPLLLHPKPDSVFFLGMGTGITAGASLVHPVSRVVIAELSPDVVEAARVFFWPYLHGLFDDSRAVVIAEDGRNYLFGTREQFDVIIADLFMPWKAGVGSLYSREHYQAARERLADGGLYVQWLPLFQISNEEFGVVARTMRGVFPLVTLWRGTMAPGWETAAIIGHQDEHPLDRERVLGRLEQTDANVLRGPSDGDSELGKGTSASGLTFKDVLLQYCGNLTSASDLLDRYSVNRDDRPIIEYGAPISHRRTRANEASWFVGQELLSFLGRLMLAAPPETDPFLSGLSPEELNGVRAGLALYLSQVLDAAGQRQAAWRAQAEFQRLYGGEVFGESSEDELEQTRRELAELIETYQERIRALREHLREAEEEAVGQQLPSSAAGESENRN